MLVHRAQCVTVSGSSLANCCRWVWASSRAFPTGCAGDYILQTRPGAVVVETAVTPEHGALPGNSLSCSDRVAEGPTSFFMRMFCQVCAPTAPRSVRGSRMEGQQLFGALSGACRINEARHNGCCVLGAQSPSAGCPGPWAGHGLCLLAASPAIVAQQHCACLPEACLVAGGARGTTPAHAAHACRLRRSCSRRGRRTWRAHSSGSR